MQTMTKLLVNQISLKEKTISHCDEVIVDSQCVV